MARSQRYNGLIIVGLCLCLLGGAYAVQNLSAAPVQEEIVPDQSFKTTDGKTITLHQFKGKNILVHFWASWCLPCIKEFPTLISTAQKNENVVIIAISVDSTERAMSEFLDKIDNAKSLSNVYHVHDPRYQITINNEKVMAYPETFVLKPDLTLKGRVSGGLDWNRVKFEK